MQFPGRIQVRPLAGGVQHECLVRASDGRVLELDLQENAADCMAGTAAELVSSELICLGMIERRNGDRVWISVEHLLDRQALNALRSVWGEQGIAEDLD